MNILSLIKRLIYSLAISNNILKQKRHQTAFIGLLLVLTSNYRNSFVLYELERQASRLAWINSTVQYSTVNIGMRDELNEYSYRKQVLHSVVNRFTRMIIGPTSLSFFRIMSVNRSWFYK